MTGSIIVVDDSAIVRDTVQAYLTRAGFQVRVAEDGTALRRLWAEAPADLVILDLKLPGDDGLSLMRFLRATTSCGIIMLTADAQPSRRVAALEGGADDYLCKPHEPRELLARIRAVLRRIALDPRNRPEPGLSWRLDSQTRTIVTTDNRRIRLTDAESKLLHVLMQQPGAALSRDALLSTIYDRCWTYFDRSIDVLVARLRRKLDVAAPGQDPIRAVRGTGYLFCPTGEAHAA
ncbi:response regulator transcription factor [Lichenihabitans sp. Uapishka_5]|uniref:response regulator transcription factor n=1 Tax=Lichenihabitans sp. Uapishka_5 TaxID=3037302 RepID=UPI0029E80D59|nr:response regulator transcription factor [Lichenihabitans sp. Uapishka_5]MDX7950866.1 response regulator transcription factor [Lichenihabitans sp. Uapishka_5]